MSAEQQRKEVNVFVDRVAEGTDRGAVAPAVCDEEFSQGWPAVYEYLTATAFEDGSPRVVSSLLFFMDDSLFKALLNDRQHHRGLWMTAETFRGVLDGLEALLEAGKAPWRADRQQTPARSGKGR